MIDTKQDVYRKACTEVWSIISNLEEDLIQKIPSQIRDTIYQNRDAEYEFIFDISLPIEEIVLLPETTGIISYLWSEYFCSDMEKEKWHIYDNFYEQKILENFGGQYGMETLFQKKEKDNTAYNKNFLEQ